MTRRALLAVHWLLTTATAMTAVVAAPLPFTGRFAGAAGVLAAAAVGLIGYATTPTTPRKDVRP